MIPSHTEGQKTIRGGIIMKKKFLVAMMSCMLMAGAVTGCGSKTADAPTTTAAEVTTEAETEAGTEETTAEDTSSEAATEAEAADASALVEGEGTYLAWSAKEWNEADDAEKAAAAKEYLIESTKVAANAAGQEFTDDMVAAITDEQIATVEDSLETAFAADETITIQQMLDAAAEVMNAMMETEAADGAEDAETEAAE